MVIPCWNPEGWPGREERQLMMAGGGGPESRLGARTRISRASDTGEFVVSLETAGSELTGSLAAILSSIRNIQYGT